MKPNVEQVFGSARAVISETFSRMEIAEEVIAAAKRRTRSKAKRAAIHGAFAALVPGEEFRGSAEWVYRAHCEELVGRIRLMAGSAYYGNFVPATRVEVMLALAALSLVEPMKAAPAALYRHLFDSLCPNAPLRSDEAPPGEATVRELADLEIDLRERLAKPKRGEVKQALPRQSSGST